MFSSYGSPSSTSSSYSSSSFTSYSSYSSRSSPMDIAPSPFSTRGPDASCAFPSWPRRSSLCEYDASEERATSYISDEDLFPQDFEDDVRSESSHGSPSPIQSPPAPVLTEVDIMELQRERAAYQREVMKLLLSEKERRRQQAKRRASSSSKKAKSKLTAMTPIAEAE
ncbi:REJ domain-containing protein [Madurella fahalii]|uniref:REJ domain-containing protein n=1 Tax=Madurella fahalii TaxID=1157608 RepID=A0ABQ0G669_9PEZI